MRVDADRRDPFPRRTATVSRLAPWAVELVRSLPGLVTSYGLRPALTPRTRERVIMAVTEVNGCRYCAWIHGGWQKYLGHKDATTAEEAVLGYARACAEAGRPLDTADLAPALTPAARRALRATVAQIELSNLVGNTVGGLLARLTRKRPFDLVATGQEIAAVAVAVPVAVPLLVTGAVLRGIDRAAPPVPVVATPPAGEANLLVHLLAAAIPAYLGNAAVRLAVLGLPVKVTVGLRAGRTPATIRIGRGGVAVENGIAPDAHLVVEGEVEPLLRLAAGSVLRELGSIRIRPR